MQKQTIYRAVATGAFGFCLGQGAVMMWPNWSAWTWWSIAVVVFPFIWAPEIWEHRHSLTKAIKTQNEDYVPGRIVQYILFFIGWVFLIAVFPLFVVDFLPAFRPVVLSLIYPLLGVGMIFDPAMHLILGDRKLHLYEMILFVTGCLMIGMEVTVRGFYQ